MTMRKLLAVFACAAGVWMFGACGSDNSGGSASDPVAGCKQINQIVCDKIFKCFTQTELESSKDTIGLNASDCAVKFDAECIPEMVNCNAGETFHGDKLSSCIDGFKTFTCDDIKRQPRVDPAACGQVCTK
jgi:hypothetical protein